MRRYLVVGNQTLQSARLLQELRDCTVEEPARFHLVVPATPARDHAFWTEGEALSIARTRLRAALDALHREGLLATGEVGDANATAAVGDALRRQPSDEVI